MFGEEIRASIHRMKEMPFEKVEIRSVDGLILRGRYLDAGYNKTAICFHGYHTNAFNNFSNIGEFLISEGFNLLLVDERCAGESEGKVVTLGLKESLDVKSWVRFATSRNASEILIYGMSMGATSVGLGSDRLKNTAVKGMVLDCGYASPRDQLLKQANDRHVPGIVMLPVIWLMAKLVLRIDIYDTVMNHLENSKIPAFFIHAKTDKMVPIEDTQKAYDSLKAPKMKLFTENGGHTTAFLAGGDKSKDMLHTFIQANFET